MSTFLGLVILTGVFIIVLIIFYYVMRAPAAGTPVLEVYFTAPGDIKYHEKKEKFQALKNSIERCSIELFNTEMGQAIAKKIEEILFIVVKLDSGPPSGNFQKWEEEIDIQRGQGQQVPSKFQKEWDISQTFVEDFQKEYEHKHKVKARLTITITAESSYNQALLNDVRIYFTLRIVKPSKELSTKFLDRYFERVVITFGRIGVFAVEDVFLSE